MEVMPSNPCITGGQHTIKRARTQLPILLKYSTALNLRSCAWLRLANAQCYLTADPKSACPFLSSQRHRNLCYSSHSKTIQKDIFNMHKSRAHQNQCGLGLHEGLIFSLSWPTGRLCKSDSVKFRHASVSRTYSSWWWRSCWPPPGCLYGV